MTMTEWAEKEISDACKRENPNYDGESFDYGCSIYQSALKAFKSIMEDDHSILSFSVTKNILIRLLNNIPLSPITDDDFPINEKENDLVIGCDEWLKKRGLKSKIQCSRRSSLFRYEHLDGTISYHDNERSYCIDIDNPDCIFGSGMSRIIDDMFPITMPYTPSDKKYHVYVQDFLLDPKNGDFDHTRVVKIVTPEGKEIIVDNPKYIKREINGKMESCSLEEWEKDYEEYLYTQQNSELKD